MKIKYSRIWGVALVLVVLAALMIPMAAPVSAANLAWTTVSTPSAIPFNTLVTGAGGNNWLADVAPDGKTIFAYDNTNKKLYRSTNGGLGFSTSSPTTLTPGQFLNGITATALAVSADYATDNSVVVASATTVYLSTDGGQTFATMSATGLAGSITSVDLGPNYTGGMAIVVGTADGAGGGGAAKFAQFGWTPLNFGKDVYAVAFSPTYKQDAEILAVTADGANTYLETQLGTKAANADFNAATIAAKATSPNNRAVIAFPADYSLSNNKVIIGLGTLPPGAITGTEDVYRVTLNFPPTNALVNDLNLGGVGTGSNIYSLAFKGNIADGRLYVGMVNSPVIWSATGVSGSAVTFNPSSKSPIGTSNTTVMASPVAADTSIWALTSGANSALALSTDAGVNFNLISLVNVTGTVFFNDLSVVDANNMFLILRDSVKTIFYVTTNGGSNWMGTFTHQMTGTEQMTKIYRSPAYATDKTVFVTQNDSRLWRSSDAGMTFFGYSTPSGNLLSLAVVDSTTYFMGTDVGVFKSGSFVAATGFTGQANSLDYVSPTVLFAANTNGNVYLSTNNGVSFSSVPLGAPTTPGSIITADVNYTGTGPGAGVVYAVAAPGDTGIVTFTVGTSLAWGTVLTNTAGVNAMAQSPDGTFYASTAVAGAGVERSVNPNTAGQFYPVSPALAGFPAGGVTKDVEVIATGTVQVPNNTVYVIGNSGAADAIYTYQDTLVAAPAVTSPANNAQVPTNVNFTWSPVTIPSTVTVKYLPQIALDSNFQSYIYGGPGTASQGGTILAGNTLNLSPGTIYYFRVKVSKVSAGGTDYDYNSKYSTTAKLNVQLAQASPDLNLLAPAPGATNVPRMPVLQWAAVLGAQSYDVQVADNPVFVNPVDSQTGLNTTVWTLTKQLDYGKTYYWRIRATSASGVVSDWISGAFTVANAPAPTTTAPPPTTPPPPITPTVTVVIPTQPVPTITVTQQPVPTPSTPAYIWVIIVIGAILVIAVIVLIARTRRV